MTTPLRQQMIEDKPWSATRASSADSWHALKYLAPYIFRVAISNARIVKLENGRATFRYRSSDTQRTALCNLPAEQFMHRFLQHVLPKGFVKMRYYGFLAPGLRPRLAATRQQLGGSAAPLPVPAPPQTAPPCSTCDRPMLQRSSTPLADVTGNAQARLSNSPRRPAHRDDQRCGPSFDTPTLPGADPACLLPYPHTPGERKMPLSAPLRASHSPQNPPPGLTGATLNLPMYASKSPKSPLQLNLPHAPARHFALIPIRGYNCPDGLVQHRILRRPDAA